MQILNYINSIILNDAKFLDKIRYNKHGYYIHKKVRQKDIKVSIIIPVYNAENTISKTIDSIIKQSIGLENLEIILIDDKSDDQSRQILLKYAKEFPNISPVFLKENSGSPAIPRNLGIEIAQGRYIMFVDADDWLHPKGINSLYKLLESTGDNYAIGKTIKVSEKGKHIIGEYNNWSTRKSINPLSIVQIFHHLAPTGRMIKKSFLKEKGIKFPNKKYAEDKQFFLDVLTCCETISTTKDIIYYANRYSDNESLTTRTDIFEKTDANISVIKHVIEKDLPIETEKILLNRLYEFDCITRLFNRGHFLKSNNKQMYFDKFAEVLQTTKDLRYNFESNFRHDWHNILVSLFNRREYDKVISLIEWNYYDQNKQIYIKDNLPYYNITIGTECFSARVEMYSEYVSSVTDDNSMLIRFKAYGDYIDELNSLTIRQRNNDLNELEFPIIYKSENLYEATIPFDDISKLNSSSYSVFIKYNNYKKSLIKMNTRSRVKYNNKQLDFYTTIADNYGLNIK